MSRLGKALNVVETILFYSFLLSGAVGFVSLIFGVGLPGRTVLYLFVLMLLYNVFVRKRGHKLRGRSDDILSKVEEIVLGDKVIALFWDSFIWHIQRFDEYPTVARAVKVVDSFDQANTGRAITMSTNGPKLEKAVNELRAYLRKLGPSFVYPPYHD
jgi:hypothetical protein